MGGLLACGALVLGKYLLIDRLFRESFAFNEASWIEWSHVMVTCGIVMAIGLLVSIVVSYLTLLKYLRV
jgi:cell division transport system permease protein